MRLLLVILVAAIGGTSAVAQNSGSYYLEPGTYSTQRESDPPAYVRNLAQAGHEALGWLDVGLQQRYRYERRDDDIRRFAAEGFDDPWLSRTRVYLGVRSRLDPLRLAVELQDSRSDGSRFAPDNREVNKTEFIQGYAELYFTDALNADPRGNQRPVSLRVSIGQDSNDWQLELMTFHPITRLLDATDKADRNQRFSVVVAHWRAMPRLTLEPHYFHLKQDAAPANGNRARDIHAPGLRGYGRTADGALNYEFSVMAQFGDDGTQEHAATSATFEAGYTWQQHPWRPRLGGFYGYASGDRSPADRQSNRFERFFGFARPWSASDYVIFENLHAPKLRLEFQPLPRVRVDLGYGAYWLASATDRFNNLLAGSAFNRDDSGQSGDFVGQELDARARVALGEYVDVTVGYSHFRNGAFVRSRQRAAVGGTARDSDFVYVELMFSLF